MAEEQREEQLNTALLHAALKGDVVKMRELIAEGADVCYQEEERGRGPLMNAAENGHMEAVDLLLQRGAPWNALDRSGKCAGQLALEEGHQDVADRLLNAGVTAELLFAALEKKSQLVTAQAKQNNEEYISRPVEYKDGDLIDESQRGVMMMWEKPLMEAHAELMCRTSGDVLNVGFGLGLVDTAIQSHHPRSHTIIEAHPEVYKKMIADGWDKKPGVTIIHSRWQDAVESLPQFDAIFFDTFDDVLHMHEFHVWLPKILRKGGIYSFFNGICPDNFFFQAVACQVLQLQLQDLGFDTVFQQMPVKCDEDETWQNVKYRYFENDTYHFPIVFWNDAPPKVLMDPEEVADDNADQAE
eukprot:m.13863 g.13863  ORF g.13863 m.13863 type:complete len:356 (-) comp7440_c0_seq2:254-1321(-)